ncbi:MAG: TIGR04551 family protein [Deltaproteobacteria bacterium]|nr:TIGR04551 family protein [Deltaproteobacteria bacterium]
MRRPLLIAALLAAAPMARAGWETVGSPFSTAGESPDFDLDGSLRVRGDLLYNLDLDRGPTPSGDLLFPAPGSDPQNGQLLTGADMRLRLQPVMLYRGIAVRAQVDVFDNLALGSTPRTAPSEAAVSGQDAPRFGVNALVDAIAVRRVWAEAALPVGLLSIGRMPSHWGLGIVANDGLGEECDLGDSADRIALVTPLLGHIWGIGFDWSASGPQLLRDGAQLDRDPADDVRSIGGSVLNWLPEAAIDRKVEAGKLVVSYGLLGSYRWQEREAVAASGQGGAAEPLLWVERGSSAWIVDGWAKLRWSGLRVEAEAAYLNATIANASLVPGLRLHRPLTASQWGGALETEWAPRGGSWRVGLDAGIASGDPAPGLGGRDDPRFGAPGDLDGAQIRPPYDMAVDNFRFHRDYLVDRILWRQIVGTVTDGAYLRGRGGIEPARGLWLELAAIGSLALEAESAPGRSNLLGVEIDPTLRYRSRDGLEVMLAYGFLWPLAGLGNREPERAARPGQTVRWMTRFVF